MLCRMQGEVYLDEDRAFMKALGDRWLGVQVRFTLVFPASKGAFRV